MWAGQWPGQWAGVVRPAVAWNPLRTEAPPLCWATSPRMALPLQGKICQTAGWILSERSLCADRSPAWTALAGIELGKMAGPVGWRLPNKQKWVIQGEVHQKRLTLHYQVGCQNGLQEDCKWLFFQGQARFAKPGATAAWRPFGEVVPPGMGQPSLEPCTETKCVPWRWQIWILIDFPLAQLASSLGSTIQHITFEIFLISSLYFADSQRSFLESY